MPQKDPVAYRSISKRDGTCAANHHNCLDTGHGDQCCDNDSYCYVTTAGESRCCPLGSNCLGDSYCRSDAYYCTRTKTVTPSPPRTKSTSPPTPTSPSTTTTSPSTPTLTTETGCCGRHCPFSRHYLCAASLGGNCCPYGAECRADGSCVAVMTSTTTEATTLLTMSVMNTTEAILFPTTTTTTTAAAMNHGAGDCLGVRSTSDAAASCTTTTTTSSNSNSSSGRGLLSTVTLTAVTLTVVAGVGALGGLGWCLWTNKRRCRRRADTDAAGSGSGSGGGEISQVSQDPVVAPRSSSSSSSFSCPQAEMPGDIPTPVELDASETTIFAAGAGAAKQGPEKADDDDVLPLAASDHQVYELDSTEVFPNVIMAKR